MAVSTTAKTRKDVDSTAVKDRLWDSLNYSYGKRGEQITKDYNKLASQTSNQLLSRGMQRSSYGAQTVANVGKQMADALGQNASDMIADYENRLYQIERDEKADEQWERQFAANREDAAWNKQFQTSQFEYGKERDLVADAQWQKQYGEQLRQFNEQMAYQRERANVSDAQWQKEYDQAKAQFDAQMAEQKRQFDLNFNEDVRRYNNQIASAGASSGGGGTTNPGANNPGTNNPPPQTGLTMQELAANDIATSMSAKAKQIVSSSANQIQIDQYQRQINALSQRLPRASSNSERTNINNQINDLQKKINALR